VEPGRRSRVFLSSVAAHILRTEANIWKGKTMTNTNSNARKPVAIGIAAAIALSGAFALGTTAPASAAPFSVSQAAVKEAAPENVIDVRRRHRHWHGGHAVAGLALGIIGAAIAHKAYRRHHRHHYHPYYYGGYYGAPGCIRRHGAWYCR
jgi:hypothetical protein